MAVNDLQSRVDLSNKDPKNFANNSSRENLNSIVYLTENTLTHVTLGESKYCSYDFPSPATDVICPTVLLGKLVKINTKKIIIFFKPMAIDEKKFHLSKI